MKLFKLLLLLPLLLPNFAKASGTYTVGTAQTYTTLKDAFDAINAGTISGAIILQIAADCSETATASLNASGSGSASYTSITIYPTGATRTISGGIAGALVTFNGADNVTIDGRIDQAGSNEELVFSNTNTSTSSYTIVFQADATNNTIQYCTIQGSETSVTKGVIAFLTGSSGGNDNNTITLCTITLAGANKPVNGIYSNGSASNENSSNNITSNNIVDFTECALYLNTNNTSWNITGNSFYQLASASITLTATMYMIWVGDGSSYSITGNFLGGRAPNCGGTTYILASSAYRFRGFFFDSPVTGTNTVSSNTIQNITFTTTSSTNPVFSCIQINPSNGTFNIGSSGNANTFGATSGTGSVNITDNGGSSTASMAVVYSIGTGEVNVTYNNIGAITLAGGNVAGNFMSLYTSSSTAATFSNNTVGNSTANNMVDGIARTGRLYMGVFHESTGTITASNNTFQNFNLSGNGTGGVRGVSTVTASSCTISSNTINTITSTRSTNAFKGFATTIAGTTICTSNTISDITLSNANSVFYGIDLTSSADNITCSNNIVGSSSSNNITTAGNDLHIGIYVSVPSSKTTTINANVVQQINMSSTGSSNTISAIWTAGAGTALVTNNVISDITSATTQAGGYYNFTGLDIRNTGNNNTVNFNRIKNITLTTVSAVDANIAAIYMNGAVSGSTCNSNKITGMSTACTGTPFVYGIRSTAVASSWAFHNNIIILNNAAITSDCLLYGINSSGTGTTTIYHNTIKIGGTSSGAGTQYSAALNDASASGTRTVKNNILYNLRTGGTGTKHRSLRNSGTSTGLTVGYNYHEYTDHPSWNNIAQSSFANYITNSGGTSEINMTGGAITIDANGAVTANSTSNVADNGIDLFSGGTVTVDYDNEPRDVNPWRGAFESAAAAFVWMGTSSIDWATAANWDNGSVPTSSDNARIPTGKSVYSTIDEADAVAAKLTIQSGGSITATSGKLTLTTLKIDDGGSATINGAEIETSGNATILGTITLSSGTLDVDGTFDATGGNITGTGTAIIELGGATITSLGTFLAGSTTVDYNRAGDQSVLAETYYNLTVSGSGTKTLAAGTTTLNNDLSVSAGTLAIGSNTLNVTGAGTIPGTTTISTGTLNVDGTFDATLGSITFSGGGFLLLGGTVTSLGSLTIANNCTVTYDGTTQNVDAVDYYNLTISGSGVKTLTGDIDISGIGSLNGEGVLTVDASCTFAIGDNTITHSRLDDVNDGRFHSIAGTVTLNNGNWTPTYGMHGAISCTGQITVTGTGIIYLTGGGTQDITPITAGSGTVYYSRNGNQTIAANTFNHLYIGGTSGTKTLSGNITTKDLTIVSGVTLDVSSGDNYSIDISGDWNNSGTFTPQSGLVTFNGTSSITTGGTGAGKPFYNLTLNGTSATLANNIDIDNNFTITSGTWDVSATPYNMNVGGNWSNSGTFSYQTGSVTFDGGSEQTISGSNATTFNDVTLSNVAGLAITKGPTVNGIFTFSAGNVTASTSTEPLIIETSGSFSGAADTKCVVGYCKKNTSAATKFTFPVGTATTMRTIAVTPAGTGATSYLASYNNSGQGTYTYDQGKGTIDHVSKIENWDLTRSGASPENCYIELTYNANSMADANYSQLIVGHFNGSNWESTGGTYTVIGDATSGTITTDSYVTSFSPFAPASSTANNPLPIELLFFDVVKFDNIIEAKWETATEFNNDYFTVERSANGSEFTEIARVQGSGNSNGVLNYSYIDLTPLSGQSYYRLKQTDFDGTESYSEIRTIYFENSQSINITLYPNPNTGNSLIILFEGMEDNTHNIVQIDIFNLLGENVYSKIILEYSTETSVSFNNKLPSGIYHIICIVNGQKIIQKLIVK